jgi:hypothetical protein
MTRSLVPVLAALALAPAALADGVSPYAIQNGDGVAAPHGGRTVAIGMYGARTTMLTRLAATGSVLYATPLAGTWGLPTIDGDAEGVSADGRTLVLASIPAAFPRTHSRFLVLDARSFRTKLPITLRGDWGYDALSPTGDWLYLIQHVDARDLTHYVVRRFDLISGQLMPGRVADRTQKSWIMQGSPITRTTSSDGRWVYTLYANPGGFPFVHALDTVRGVAHCVGLPWRGDGSAPYNMRLALQGSTLAVRWASGRPWYRLDTRTWRLSPDRRSGFPWWTLALVAAGIGLVPPLRWLRDRAPGRREVVRDAARPRRRGAWHRRDDRDGGDRRPARPERRRKVDDARHGARAPAP